MNRITTSGASSLIRLQENDTAEVPAGISASPSGTTVCTTL